MVMVMVGVCGPRSAAAQPEDEGGPAPHDRVLLYVVFCGIEDTHCTHRLVGWPTTTSESSPSLQLFFLEETMMDRATQLLPSSLTPIPWQLLRR